MDEDYGMEEGEDDFDEEDPQAQVNDLELERANQEAQDILIRPPDSN